jgi:hypothetical protein
LNAFGLELDYQPYQATAAVPDGADAVLVKVGNTVDLFDRLNVWGKAYLDDISLEVKTTADPPATPYPVTDAVTTPAGLQDIAPSLRIVMQPAAHDVAALVDGDTGTANSFAAGLERAGNASLLLPKPLAVQRVQLYLLGNVEALTVRTTCTNRDLPSRLPFGNEQGDFELEGAAPVRRIVALLKPTDTLRPPVGKNSLWRLISQLSLNYMSLVDEGREALQEILRLYNFTGSAHSEKQIEGILKVTSRRHFARVVSEDGVSFARGTRVDMEFDEEQFVGGGVFLFAAVLECFLGLYVSMNSFSQLCAVTRQRKETLKLWPPRAGRKILL